MVEFCPKCGTLLVPSRRGNKVFLVCRRCKYEKSIKSSEGYREVQIISEDKRLKTAVIEETKEIDKEKRKEERELLQELYEIVLETMEQEQLGEEGAEEG